jgi:nicotinic acid mononucleotide adenylyltransferase
MFAFVATNTKASFESQYKHRLTWFQIICTQLQSVFCNALFKHERQSYVTFLWLEYLKKALRIINGHL